MRPLLPRPWGRRAFSNLPTVHLHIVGRGSPNLDKNRHRLAALALIGLILSTLSTGIWSDAIDIFNRGYQAHTQGKLHEAIKYYNLAIQWQGIPDNRLSYVHHYLGMAQYQLQDYASAIDNFNRAISLNEDIGITYLKRGNAHSQTGDFKSAVEDYTNSFEYAKNQPGKTGAESLHNRGFAWYGLGEYVKAIEDYNRALEIDPKLPDTFYNRSLAWLALGEYSKAITDCDRALRIRPEDDDIYKTRANAWFKLEQYGNAVEDYSSAIKLDPANSGYYLNRGIVFFHQDQFELAINDYNSALTLTPEDAKIKQYLEKALAAMETKPEQESGSGQNDPDPSVAKPEIATTVETGSDEEAVRK